MGRKVADSLQLFRETTSTSKPSSPRPVIEDPSSSSFGAGDLKPVVIADSSDYVVKSAEVVRAGSLSLGGRRPSISINVGATATSRARGKSTATIQEQIDDEVVHRVGRHHEDDEEEEEIGTVFVKRQEWPDREARAARRLASTATSQPSSTPKNSSQIASASGATTVSSSTRDPIPSLPDGPTTTTNAALLRRESGDVLRNDGDDEALWKYDGDRGRLMERELRLRGNTIVGNTQSQPQILTQNTGTQSKSQQQQPLASGTNHDASRIEREGPAEASSEFRELLLSGLMNAASSFYPLFFEFCCFCYCGYFGLFFSVSIAWPIQVQSARSTELIQLVLKWIDHTVNRLISSTRLFLLTGQLIRVEYAY